ncbi:hypothetical protein FACS18949_06690 [Clostridia bacterium]|nr:hypothetical protein FACS18949_06690 [Clostridia bacterium]
MIIIKRILSIALAGCLWFTIIGTALALNDKTPVTEVPAAGSSIDIAAVQKQLDAAENIVPGDPKATESASRLLRYLYAVARTDDVLFGRQRDTDAKATEYAGSSNSDTRDMVGVIPAVVGADAGEGLIQNPAVSAAISLAAAREGAIITLSAHMGDFSVMNTLNDDNGYQGSQSKVKDMTKYILPGGEKNGVFTAYLDKIAEYAALLDERDIPLLFRPYHEHTGNWFWWAKGWLSEEDYITLWRYTVDYLRDTKNIHNILYEFSPDSPNSAAEYMYGYPGDEYVDVFGLDFYDSQWHGPTFEDFLGRLKTQLGVALKLAGEHRKPFALTETGIQNNADWDTRPDTWFADVSNLLKPFGVSYFMVWASWSKTQYMIPYKTSDTAGHPYVDGFIKFYNDPHSVFADGAEFYGDKLNYSPGASPSAEPSVEPGASPAESPLAKAWPWIVIGIVIIGGVAAILRRRKNKGE